MGERRKEQNISELGAATLHYSCCHRTEERARRAEENEKNKNIVRKDLTENIEFMLLLYFIYLSCDSKL